MSAASDMPPPRRTDLSLLRWDAAWIDPAVRRMAEAAARQADLPIEIWMERAIRSACGMPKMAPPSSEATRPAPARASPPLATRATDEDETPAVIPTRNFSALLAGTGRLNGRRDATPTTPPAPEPVPVAEAPIASAPESAESPEPPHDAAPEPLEASLPDLEEFAPPLDEATPNGIETGIETEPAFLPPSLDDPSIAPMPDDQLQPAPRRGRAITIIWATGIAAILAILAVSVLHQPGLLGQRAVTTSGRHVEEASLPPPSTALGEPTAESAAKQPALVHGGFTVQPVPATPAKMVAATMPSPRIAPSTATAPAVSTPTSADPSPAPPAMASASPAPAAPAMASPNPALNKPSRSSASVAAPAPVVASEAALPPVAATAAPKLATAPPPVKPSVPVPSIAAVPPMKPNVTATMPLPSPTTASVAALVPSATPMPNATTAAPMTAAKNPEENLNEVAAMTPPPPPTAAPAPTAPQGRDAKLAAQLQPEAAAGDSLAQFRLGIMYALGKGVAHNYQRAAGLLHSAAQSGIAEAQYDYGVLCDKGLGVPQDSAEATKWYAKAAKQGHAPAALNLGYAYAEGQGVHRDLPRAAHWFRRAARDGLINAQFNIAYMYEKGAGVKKSVVNAYAWYSIAASKGDAGSQTALKRVSMIMTPQQITSAKRIAREVRNTIRVR